MYCHPIANRVQRWTAFTSLALIAVTWRLWTPTSAFPQIPACDWLCTAPPWLDWVLLACLMIGLAVQSVGYQERTGQIASSGVLISAIAMILLNQHRLQAWVYLLLLITSILMTSGQNQVVRNLRWLLVGIYFYSAMGKFDFEFLHTVGQQMLGVILRLAGVSAERISHANRVGLALLFPVVELALAIGLAWPKTRRAAGVMAIGLHAALIVILGPWGLNHRVGVLLWNIQVAVLAFWLFVTATQQPTKAEPATVLQPRLNWLGKTILIAALFLPSLERFGIWDHWPSWALYAPHSSRVWIEVSAPAVEHLPKQLRDVVTRNTIDDGELAVWTRVPIDQWSLEALDTPIYPQARFQIGVAEWIASHLPDSDGLRATVLSGSARWTGQRSQRTLVDYASLRGARELYWLNTHPRTIDD